MEKLEARRGKPLGVLSIGGSRNAGYNLRPGLTGPELASGSGSDVVSALATVLDVSAAEMIVSALESACGEASTFEARDDGRALVDAALLTWMRKGERA